MLFLSLKPALVAYRSCAFTVTKCGLPDDVKQDYFKAEEEIIVSYDFTNWLPYAHAKPHRRYISWLYGYLLDGSSGSLRLQSRTQTSITKTSKSWTSKHYARIRNFKCWTRPDHRIASKIQHANCPTAPTIIER